MNRETRDKFASGTKQADLTVGNACWETPPAVFAKLNADFGPFNLDLTADATRHLCPIWFGPDSPVGCYDALTDLWSHHGSRGYSNPPYGPFIQRLLPKAREEARRGFTSVLLLPLRVTRAFREHVLYGPSQLLFCDKRITFWENGEPRINPRTGKPDGALFDSIVVVFAPDTYDRPILGTWHVPPHTPNQIAAANRRAARKRAA